MRCSQPHQLTAWQRFTDDGPLAFLPLARDGDQYWSSIVWSCVPEHAEQLMALDDAGFAGELGKAFELRLTLGFTLDENPAADPVRMRLQTC